MSGVKPIRIGLIGCGGFGRYALDHFLKQPGVSVSAVADVYKPAAESAGKHFGVEGYGDVGLLLAREDVDLAYLATPPGVHYEQAMAAMRAGKHVICEKPLAVTIAQANEMIAYASKEDRLVVANLMQRYNPLFEKVKTLIEQRVLGEFIHGYFENYASDEKLDKDHWFWKDEVSGGIFIEHAVHFFDLFEGWFGSGKVVSAGRGLRPGGGIEEQVYCTAEYGECGAVNFYHGFHQASRMDRQELRLVFERGDVTLYGWIPTAVRVYAIVDEKQIKVLGEVFEKATVKTEAVYTADDRHCTARHKTLDVHEQIELWYGKSVDKQHRYGVMVRAMLADQVAWIWDRQHRRVITEENGRQSLKMAVAATELARAKEG